MPFLKIFMFFLKCLAEHIAVIGKNEGKFRLLCDGEIDADAGNQHPYTDGGQKDQHHF
jgi:hypothetical protein